MFKIENNKITIIQGDTGIMRLSLGNYLLGEGDTVYFTAVNRSVGPYSVEPAIKKKVTTFNEGAAVFYFEREDTINLPAASYSYDVQVNTKDGRIDTVIPANRFIVLEGISNEY